MTLAQVHAYGNDRYKQAVGDLLIDLPHWGMTRPTCSQKGLLQESLESCTYRCVQYLSTARVCDDTLDIVENDVQQAKQSTDQMACCNKSAVGS